MTAKIDLAQMTLDQLQALLVRVGDEIALKQQAAKDETLAQIKKLVESGGLTQADLKKVLGGSVPGAKISKKAPIRFRGSKGEEWSGRGQWPRWLKETGLSKQDFLIDEDGKTPWDKKQA